MRGVGFVVGVSFLLATPSSAQSPALTDSLAVALQDSLAVALKDSLAVALKDSLAVADWPAYGRDPGGTRYSPAAQITRDNVARLQVAWIYRTGDYAIGEGPTRFEATPLLVDGTLYVATPFGRVIALDPRTGEERWAYDGRVDLSGHYGDFATRGVSTWLDHQRRPGEACRRRIFLATIDARLVALDAATGRPCRDFGTNGQVDLKTDLVNPPFELGEYQVTSPAAVLHDLVIVGSSIGDNNRADAPSGVVRAFDARTGRQRWAWDPIPRRPGLPGFDTWRGRSAERTGAANAWSVISVDAERDLVFVPVGSASPDFYGGERLGQNLYANSVVALRGSTGQVVWHFQAVHHDIWDYDVPAQPVLFTVRRDGREIAAVVQATKMGHLYILSRQTGEPLYPVEERAVPGSDVPGEEAWPTQPFPAVPKPLVPQTLTAADAWGATPQDRDWCRATLASLRSDGIFTPPSLRGSVLFPGNIGGSHWGGVSVDPVRGIAVTPTNRLATVVRLVPRAAFDSARRASPGWQATPQRGTPYGMMRQALRAPSGLPCNAPPWGALVALDLATGAVKWEAPLGAMAPAADSGWGAINLGGAMITAGGLVFVGATPDQHLRAFDVETGRELWKAALPAAANALPMTYQLSDTGRQFVVVAAGGREPLWKQGDHVVAFALPRDGTTAPGSQVYP
ncbi:MAG: pyrroloquinoline quinone-dependent dehydrogenase, partial [Gemmatimonadetes bacterium]|nr:pyrroloquinoline quinone-dependent dehydrogenase [Gemmatimonadota bacterium]